ncbi:hypothetical protein ACJX0J_024308, partial [Zea mays]
LQAHSLLKPYIKILLEQQLQYDTNFLPSCQSWICTQFDVTKMMIVALRYEKCLLLGHRVLYRVLPLVYVLARYRLFFTARPIREFRIKE